MEKPVYPDTIGWIPGFIQVTIQSRIWKVEQPSRTRSTSPVPRDLRDLSGEGPTGPFLFLLLWAASNQLACKQFEPEQFRALVDSHCMPTTSLPSIGDRSSNLTMGGAKGTSD
jgi:hypothetical protein